MASKKKSSSKRLYEKKYKDFNYKRSIKNSEIEEAGEGFAENDSCQGKLNINLNDNWIDHEIEKQTWWQARHWYLPTEKQYQRLMQRTHGHRLKGA